MLTHALLLARRVGRRGAFLIFLSLLDFVYAYSLSNPTPRTRTNPTYMFLDSVAPLYVWAAVWGIAGAVLLFYAFRRRDAIGYAVAMFIKALWSVTWLLGWLFADVERGYLSAAIWGAFVLIVLLIATWPEPHLEEDNGWRDTVEPA